MVLRRKEVELHERDEVETCEDEGDCSFSLLRLLAPPAAADDSSTICLVDAAGRGRLFSEQLLLDEADDGELLVLVLLAFENSIVTVALDACSG